MPPRTDVRQPKVQKFRIDCTVKTRNPTEAEIKKSVIKPLLEGKFADGEYSIVVHKVEKA